MAKTNSGATVQLSTNGTPIIDHAATLTMEQIRNYFSFPLHEACVKLNVDQVSLNRRCRALGIKRWPYRRRADCAMDPTEVMDFAIRTEQSSPFYSNVQNNPSSSTPNNMFHTFKLDGSPGTPKTSSSMMFGRSMSSPITPTSLGPYGNQYPIMDPSAYPQLHYPQSYPLFNQHPQSPYINPSPTYPYPHAHPHINSYPQQTVPVQQHIHSEPKPIPFRDSNSSHPSSIPIIKVNEDGSSPNSNIIIPAPTKIRVPSLLISTKKRPRIGLSVANMGADEDMCESPIKKAHTDEAECGRENTPSSTDSTTPTTLSKLIITKRSVEQPGEQILPKDLPRDRRSPPLTVVTTTTVTTTVTTMDPMMCSPASPMDATILSRHVSEVVDEGAFRRKS
ncbi:RWP-RK domain protein [Acrasis kona]|uniref:RWP-RK domain protein n=1 Tax=Acrasis kona TaxID=1008807 RepID=A0AAW2Z1I0_9EUKA